MTSPLTIPVAVDIVALTVIDHTLHALVVRRGIEPFKDHLALPGGFLREGEQTEEAAAIRAAPSSPSPTSSSPPRFRPPKQEATLQAPYGIPSTPSLRPPRPSPSTTRESSRTAWSAPAPRSNTHPWPHPSAAPSSRSHSCAPRTKPSGDQRSTRAIFIAKQQKPRHSSSQPAARCARAPDAQQPSTASSPASTTRPSSSTHPCAAHPPQPRPRQ